MKKVLVFGASGSIGGSIVTKFASENWNVFAVFRTKIEQSNMPNVTNIHIDVLGSEQDSTMEILKDDAPFDSICFAQGANLNDSIQSFDEESHINLYKANCLFILKAMNFLIENNLLQRKAHVVIISSIWQNIARKNKLSYMMTKSALIGLVNSLAIDLALYKSSDIENGLEHTCFVNSISPGALDTKMTRANLTPSQIQTLQDMTPTKKLSSLEDIANATYFLSNSDGITGQMINIDYGFSYAKML